MLSGAPRVLPEGAAQLRAARRAAPASAAAPRRAVWAAAAGAAAPSPALVIPPASELRALNDSVIVLEIEAARKELVELGMKKALKQEVKTHHFGLLRKKVAVLKTIRRERELEQGVAMRESRRADKRLQLSNPFW